MNATVSAIWTTPVKGLALHARDHVELTSLGVADDRIFFLVDEQHSLVNGKRAGNLSAVRADYAPDTLTLTFPDGRVLSEPATDGAALETKFFSLRPRATRVCPELSAALSEFTGHRLSLVRADPALMANDRGPGGAISLVSIGSLEHLSGLAGRRVDTRRFRMLFDVDGMAPHAEDDLVGQRVQVGGALVRFNGHVGRCLVTKRDPDSGEVDLDTLGLLATYRRHLETTEKLAFGIFGEVLEPGPVRIGDAVVVAGTRRSSGSAGAAAVPWGRLTPP